MAYLTMNSEIPVKGKGAKLSTKMLRFIDEYFVDMNGSEAVLRVPYKTTNPNRIASELLRHPLVSAEIRKRMDKKLELNELKADYLVNKLVAIIEAPGQKTADVLRAIELAGKSIALWKERQEITGADGGAIRTEKVRQEADEFTNAIAELAKRNLPSPDSSGNGRSGESNVVELPKRTAEGGT